MDWMLKRVSNSSFWYGLIMLFVIVLPNVIGLVIALALMLLIRDSSVSVVVNKLHDKLDLMSYDLS